MEMFFSECPGVNVNVTMKASLASITLVDVDYPYPTVSPTILVSPDFSQSIRILVFSSEVSPSFVFYCRKIIVILDTEKVLDFIRQNI